MHKCVRRIIAKSTELDEENANSNNRRVIEVRDKIKVIKRTRAGYLVWHIKDLKKERVCIEKTELERCFVKL